MNAPTTGRTGLIDRLASRVSRRSLVNGSVLIGAGALVGRAEILRSAAQESPQLVETINAVITLEAFAVTLYGAARGRGDDMDFEDTVNRFVRAAQCEEEAHFHFFEAAGAVPATTTFTVPSRQIENQKNFLNALHEVESLLVGAHMAANRQFATAGDLRLVEIGYQIGAVEAQHQALTRLFLGERLPSDRAFARWMFRDPGEAVVALKELGYIRGDGEAYSYPGPVDRYCRGVWGLVPESTEDQPEMDSTPLASPESEARA
jgi:hypothetical protein